MLRNRRCVFGILIAGTFSLALAACYGPAQPVATDAPASPTLSFFPSEAPVDLAEAFSHAGWALPSPDDDEWWVGVLGREPMDTGLARDGGYSLTVDTRVAITRLEAEGWSVYGARATDGTYDLVASDLFSGALAVVAIPNPDGTFYVADATMGFGSRLSHLTGGEATSILEIDDAGRKLTVFASSASGRTVLHSACDEKVCVGSSLVNGVAQPLREGTFPLATTDTSVLVALDAEGLGWGIVDIASSSVTPLKDPAGLVRRPLRSVAAIGPASFLVDTGGSLVIVDAKDGNVSIILSAAEREGFAPFGVPLVERWQLLMREKKADVPLTTDESRSIGVLDLASGTLTAEVSSLPFAP